MTITQHPVVFIRTYSISQMKRKKTHVNQSLIVDYRTLEKANDAAELKMKEKNRTAAVSRQN